MIVTHKPIPLYMEVAKRLTFLWTSRGFQIARKGDWIVVAPTGCTWRVKQKHHQFYVVTDKQQFGLRAISTYGAQHGNT